MQNILIVCEQFTVGGLETYIRGEAQCLSDAGCRLHLAVGRNYNNALIPNCFDSITRDLDFDVNLNTSRFLMVVNSIREIIRREAINVVHAHPFASLVPSFIAAELEGVPLIVTLHGPASLSSYGGPLYDFLLKDVVIPGAAKVTVVSNEVMALATPFMADLDKLLLLPNGVSFSGPQQAVGYGARGEYWLIVSRLDISKVEGILDFIVKAVAIGISKILVVGDGDAREYFVSQLTKLGCAEYVELLGFRSNVTELMHGAVGVGGMGRVALEGLASCRPVALIGYDGLKGVLSKDLFERAAYANFSGRGLATISEEVFAQQLNKDVFAEAYGIAVERHNEAELWRFFLENTSALEPNECGLLSDVFERLPYLSVNDETSFYQSPQVFNCLGELIVGSQNFDHRLVAGYALCEKRLGEDAGALVASLRAEIMLRDSRIQELLNEVSKLADHSVVELGRRDAEINTLKMEVVKTHSHIKEANKLLVEEQREVDRLTGEVNWLRMKVSEYVNSSSWRITRPLRLIKRLMLSGVDPFERYALLKGIYWGLPEVVRLRLNALRVRFVSHHFKSYHALETSCISSNKLLDDDKSLAVFERWVVAARSAEKIIIIPCGFEFDELVNQRPINAAKYFAERGYCVLFVAWQWSRDDVLSRKAVEVWPNIYQVPLFEFSDRIDGMPLKKQSAIYMLTMPAKILVDVVDLLRQRGFSIVYDIMDEWEAFHSIGQAPWYNKSIEDLLVFKSDLVSAVAPALVAKFACIRSDIALLGNGYMSEVLGAEFRGVASCNNENGFTVGYFGHLTDAWFDWRLLFELAAANEDVQFDIIGYGEPDWVRLESERFQNIQLIGKVHPKDLGHYVKNWSAGIIPFVEGELARSVDPIKIYEYLYFGLPAFVTGIEHLQSYPNVLFALRSDALRAFREFRFNNVGDSEALSVFLERSTWEARFTALLTLLESKKSIGDLYVL